MWIGKLVGALLGYLAGGLLGLVLGALVGHWFDRGLARAALGGLGLGNLAELRRAFFESTFAVMGHVAKADGRVSPAEIAAAEAAMSQMNLSAEQRREAIEHFNRGKQADFDLDAAVSRLVRATSGRGPLPRMFLEIQIQAALADGRIDAAEREALLRVARGLGLGEQDYARLEAFLAGGQRRARAAEGRGGDVLAEAYQELGVSREASDAEVKRAYRRLMNEHHPDKLAARGLPEEMRRVAEERTREIRAAYDTVREARGMR